MLKEIHGTANYSLRGSYLSVYGDRYNRSQKIKNIMMKFLRLITLYTKLEIVGSLILVAGLLGYTLSSLDSQERSLHTQEVVTTQE